MRVAPTGIWGVGIGWGEMATQPGVAPPWAPAFAGVTKKRAGERGLDSGPVLGCGVRVFGMTNV